jgi:Na+-driven multidrug efflux pump
LIPYLQAKTVFKIKASDFVPDFKIVFESSKIGFAMFCIQVATIISTAMINNLIGANGGTGLDFASFGLLNAYIGYIFMLFTTAFTMGLQPIASYNMGAKLYGRVAELIKVGIIQSTLAVLALSDYHIYLCRPDYYVLCRTGTGTCRQHQSNHANLVGAVRT